MVRSVDGNLLYTTDNGTMRIEQAGVGGNTVSIINLAAPAASPVCPTAICSSPPNYPTLFFSSTQSSAPCFALTRPKARRPIWSPPAATANGPGSQTAPLPTSPRFTSLPAEVKLIPTGPRLEDSILSPDGARLYVCQRDGSGIAEIGTATQKRLRTLDSPPGPVLVDVSPGVRHVVYGLLDEKAIGWTDTKTGKIVGRVDLPAPLGQIVSLHLSPDGKLAYAANENMDHVYAVDLASRRIVKNWLLPQRLRPRSRHGNPLTR